MVVVVVVTVVVLCDYQRVCYYVALQYHRREIFFLVSAVDLCLKRGNQTSMNKNSVCAERVCVWGPARGYGMSTKGTAFCGSV